MRPIAPMFAGIACLVFTFAGANPVRAASEIKLDRDHLATILAKLPKAPFEKAGQYRGAIDGFNLVGIAPKSREVVVACSVAGEFDENAILAALKKSSKTSKPTEASTPIWRKFRFEVKVAINVEPGKDGSPRLRFKVSAVKRKELEGLVGPLARVMGTGFDQIVTAYADKKARELNDHLNAQVISKVGLFRDYGMLSGVDYLPTHIVMLFDATRFRLKAIAGYVFSTPEPGTVPLYRWVNPRRGDHFYTVSTQEPNTSVYQSEGIACYVLIQPQAQAVPLLRYRGKTECFYTTSKDVEAFKKVGFRLEGVACFVFQKQVPNSVPFFQFVDPARKTHFYTTHPQAEFAR